jgi:hypothetical protein
MSLETVCRLSAHWYEGRLGAPYTRREPAAAVEHFRSVGLHGFLGPAGSARHAVDVGLTDAHLASPRRATRSQTAAQRCRLAMPM